MSPLLVRTTIIIALLVLTASLCAVPYPAKAIPVIDVEAIGQLTAINTTLGAIAIATGVSAVANEELTIKEYILDAVAYAVKQLVIGTVVGDINNWAASGFEGNPVFLENPDQFLQDAEDVATGAFIEELSSKYLNDLTGGETSEDYQSRLDEYKKDNPPPGQQGGESNEDYQNRLNQYNRQLPQRQLGDSQFFCRGLAPPIIFDLGAYGRPSGLNRFRCTLSRVEQNLERFSDDFAYGGWNTLFRLQQGSNNPYSFYANALEESDRRRQENNKTFSQGANATGGILPQVKCSKRTGGGGPKAKTESAQSEGEGGYSSEGGGQSNIDGSHTPGSEEKGSDEKGGEQKKGLCNQWTISSPARAVADYITSGIESGVGNIIPADELSEILTSVLTSLIKGAIVNLSGR